MRKDINITDDLYIALAFMPITSDDGTDPTWEAFIYNAKKTPLEHVIINASALGFIDGIEKQTATVRFYIERMEPESFRKFEVIMHETLQLHNTYWISFYQGENIGEKKIHFQLSSQWPDELSILPLLDRAGIFCL
jgi:hypothetical protein